MTRILLFYVLLCSAYGAENLKAVHVLFRHGERSPTSTYPKDPHKDYKWNGPGYLTNAGKLQMYKLGQNLRKYYVNFIPKYYWPLDVNFTSSYAERCLMSAELLGAGLFPPNDEQIWNLDLLWQPIPIHYLPRNMDHLIAMKTNCSKYDTEFADIKISSKVAEYNEKYKNLYEYLTEHTGKEINDIEDVESLYNTLEIYQLNNMSLPYWVNATLMAQMKIIGAQNLAIYSETEYMRRIKGGFFLKTVLNLMDSTLNDTNNIPIINMYSGHDLTIVHVLRSLNLIDILKPEYGSCVIFELYSDSTIKVFYWDNWAGGVNEQELMNCSNPCTIEKFKEVYKSVLPVDWGKECQIKYETDVVD